MTTPTLATWIRRGLVFLVALMPFHAFLSVWVGHLFGHQAIWQSWKEALIVLLGLAALGLVIREPQRLGRLRKSYNYCFALFALVALIVTAWIHPTVTTVLFGLKTDLEFLPVFVIAQLVTERTFIRTLGLVLLISSGAVIGFGLLQILVLPPDWLVHFGYGPSTIQPYLRVDPQLPAVRILSTLGGPNQLGSFLILPVSFVAWLLLTRPAWWQGIYLLAAGVVLWHSYSRSALIGMAAALLTLLIIRLKRSWRLPALLGVVIIVAVGLNLATNLAGSNVKLQYYLFHQTTRTTGFESSTDLHALASGQGVAALGRHPFGEGLGSAGPASFHGSHPLIPENYYLQLAIETGVAGLILFVLGEIFLGLRLWQIARQVQPAAPAALAALIGVGVINLFLHGWADSSTALVYWTVAGAAAGSAEPA